LEGIKIRIKKAILFFVSIVIILNLGGVARGIFHHSIDKINKIEEKDIGFIAAKIVSQEENVMYTLDAEYKNTWKELSELKQNHKDIMEGMDTLYVKMNIDTDSWTNPAIYLKGIKSEDYEVFLNGRIIYKSSFNPVGKDLDLDTIHKDVIIPLSKPNLGSQSSSSELANNSKKDTLVVKLNKGENETVTLIIEERAILIGEHKDIISYTIKNSIKKIVLNSIISAIAIILAMGGVFLKGRDRKILFSLSTFILCMGIYGVASINSINTILLDAPIIWSYLFYISLAYAPYTFAYFFENIFAETHKNFIIIIRRIQALSAVLLMSTVLLFTLTKGKVNIIYVGTYALYATLLVLVIVTLITSIIGAVRHNSEAQVFTVGISIYVYYLVYAVVNNTYINEAGLIFFILSLVIITARRFVRMSQDIVTNTKELENKNEALQLAWEEINESKEEIFELNKTLEKRVLDRTRDLEVSNSDLKVAMEKLQLTQHQLIQSEKMVALGGLVAGVSHEINTPVGVSVTAASHLQERTKEITSFYASGSMKKSDLEKYLNLANESAEVILSNLRRASELIKSFKQVAVDQSDEQKRNFKVKEYIEQVLLSLKPRLKKTRISIGVNCNEELQVNSFPGALSQIITNLVMNSLLHAFDEGQEGTIIFDVEKQDNNVLFTFSDNGKGINEDIIEKIFDPFFTTKRGKGGTGLGLNIVYNIVTQTLGGSIECESKTSIGTFFKIVFPVE
jgi:signal transduction histidine kinase